jgi:hypothetical protein
VSPKTVTLAVGFVANAEVITVKSVTFAFAVALVKVTELPLTVPALQPLNVPAVNVPPAVIALKLVAAVLFVILLKLLL